MHEYPKDSGPEAGRYRGLCSICKHAKTCVFPRDTNRPVLHCDEHELPDPVPKTPRESMISSCADTSVKTPGRAEGGEAPMGLCKLCENREHCTFPKPEGGVWHCEEYT